MQLEKEILPFGASDVAVKYTSNNPKVQVDNNGLVKISNEFTNTYVAIITMTPLDSKYPSSTSTLIVMQPKPEITSIKITVLEEEIETNKVYSLSASILPLDADPNQIKWSIINNVNTQAILSDKGLLDTGSVAGSITVRAESINNPNIYDV